MNDKVKLYGKTINVWTSLYKFTDRNGNEREAEIATQYEIEFTEYYTDGTIRRKGTEDFSAERYSKMFKEKWVYTWDGESLNKGGKRRFEDQGMIKYSTDQAKEVKKLMASKYPEAELIQLR